MRGRNIEEIDYIEPLLPILEQMDGMDPGRPHHEEEDLLEHTLMVYDAMVEIRPEDAVAHLMALSHDVGKLLTQGYDNDALHDQFGKRMLEMVYTRSDIPDPVIRHMIAGAQHHLRVKTICGWNGVTMNEGTLFDFIQDFPFDVSYDRVLDLALADVRGREPPVEEEYDRERTKEKIKVAMDTMEEIDIEHSLSTRGRTREDYDGMGVVMNICRQDRVEHLREVWDDG